MGIDANPSEHLSLEVSRVVGRFKSIKFFFVNIYICILFDFLNFFI